MDDIIEGDGDPFPFEGHYHVENDDYDEDDPPDDDYDEEGYDDEDYYEGGDYVPSLEELAMPPRERMRLNFSQEIKGQQVSRWATVSNNGYDFFPAEICHAGLNETAVRSLNLLATNCDVTPETSGVGEEWYAFVTGPSSPWRVLFKAPVERIDREDGYLSGLILETMELNEQERTLIYNFCIAARMIHECAQSINSWSRFRKMGLDDIEALYLGRMFTWAKGTDLLISHQNNDGSHWPLWFHGYNWASSSPLDKYIDFDKLREGRPNFEGKSCDQWTTQKAGKMSDFRTNQELIPFKAGMFSRVLGYDPEAIVAEFKVWVANHQRLLKGE